MLIHTWGWLEKSWYFAKCQELAKEQNQMKKKNKICLLHYLFFALLVHSRLAPLNDLRKYLLAIRKMSRFILLRGGGEGKDKVRWKGHTLWNQRDWWVKDGASFWSDACISVEVSRLIFLPHFWLQEEHAPNIVKGKSRTRLALWSCLNWETLYMQRKFVMRWSIYSSLQKWGEIGKTNKWPKKEKGLWLLVIFLSL